MKPTKEKNCTTCKYIHWHQRPVSEDMIEDDNRCEHPISDPKKEINEEYVCKRFEVIKHGFNVL